MRRLPLFLAALLLWATAACARELTVRVLATTDLHGNIYPYDYYAARTAQRGLAKIATLIATERAANPNTVLLDCGDTIQGTPLESVHQAGIRAGTTNSPDPMMLAMNALGYDAMTVGNHEWNFGLRNLGAAREDAKFPWISANIAADPGAAVKPFAPYFIKVVEGVKIAVIGITTTGEPVWEKAENYAGYRFLPGKEAAAKAVAEVQSKEHPDVIIAAIHAGLDRNIKTGALTAFDNLPGENMVYQIATEVPGLDAIIFGHTHSELAGAYVGGVLLMQPRNWGMSLGELDLTLEDAAGGHWRITSKNSRVIPVTAQTAADESILAIGKPYHEAAERFLSMPVAESRVEMSGAIARVEDTPLIDMIHEAQLFYSHADVSFASIFNAGLRIHKGPLTVREIAGLYIYENTLYTIEGNGRMVREALENAARYFLTCTGACNAGPLINARVIAYNYDQASGVEYEIDLRQPEGRRIRNLRYRGQPLADDQKLKIAVNNYRAGGAAGYKMFAGANVIWRSTEEIRDLMIEYYSTHNRLPANPGDNWKIVPESAARELRREVQ